MSVAHKSVRIQSSCQYLFTLLGSTSAKAARRMLMKLSPSSLTGDNPICTTVNVTDHKQNDQNCSYVSV